MAASYALEMVVKQNLRLERILKLSLNELIWIKTS